MTIKFIRPETEEMILMVTDIVFPITCNVPGPFKMEVLLEEGEDRPTDSTLEIFEKYISWASFTFLGTTIESAFKKLDEENFEFHLVAGSNSPDKKVLEEAVDVLMCLLFCLNKRNLTPSDLMDAFAKKLEVNKSRDWKQNADSTYSGFTPPDQLPF